MDKGGEAISRIGFATEGLYRTSVPSTVFTALTKDGAYPDPHIGLNVYRIPDPSSDLPLPDSSRATLAVSAELTNASETPVQGFLCGQESSGVQNAAMPIVERWLTGLTRKDQGGVAMRRLKRREFLSGLGIAAGASAAVAVPNAMQERAVSMAAIKPEERGTYQLRAEMLEDVPSGHYPKTLVNHVGFRPEAGKYLVTYAIKGADRFEIVDTRQGKGFTPVYMSKLRQSGTDLGIYQIGDFSDFKQPGTYRIQVRWKGADTASGDGGIWSHTFSVSPDVWDDPIRELINYSQRSSCGPSKHGFNTPCHVGPIKRDDGGQAKPILGGWHSAHDFQRDADETLHAAFGLMFLALARPDVDQKENLLDEIRWGNDYWHSIQSPQGFIPVGVEAIDYFNYMKLDWWDSASYKLTTAPAETFLQHNFVSIQALIAHHYRQSNPEYASRCVEAGRRCLAYLRDHRVEVLSQTPCLDLGTGIYANVHMFRVTGEEMYRTRARELANGLVAHQAADGYWVDKSTHAGNASLYSPLIVVGLCGAARHLQDDPDRAHWIAALERFASSFIKYFSEANAFGILPCRIYPDRAPQPARKWKEQQYRYFIETNVPMEGGAYWQTGNNATVAGYGVAMVYLAEILGEPWLRRLAQRQLDWVLGVNPFDASMMLGVGRNQPPTYTSKEILPPIPDIVGAVLQGPIGDDRDRPIIVPGYYPTCEYWQPHHSQTVWLMAELSADHPAGP